LLDSGTEWQKNCWYQSQILYYQAEIEHLEGNYPKAKELYQQTKELAQEIGFQRLISYANSRIATIAIALQDLEEALIIVQDVLKAAQTHQDHRSIALSHYYLAIIERDRGNPTTAKDWAEQAIQNLDRLFMKQEAANMLALIKEVG
jgi:tetratricopeptide (TPR) repeat protein